jgi:putative Holliday junction resolvase
MPVYDFSSLLASSARGKPLLGFDVGTKTIGLAISDPGWCVASPLSTIIRKKWPEDLAALVAIMRERAVGGLVLGLPRNMDGSEGPRAQSVRALAQNLLARPYLLGADLPVAFWDERLSTAAVERFLIEDDMTRQRRDAVIDKMAAAYILQGALDAMRRMH